MGQHANQVGPKDTRVSQVDVIVFDLGGVLLDWDPREVYRRMSDDEEKIQKFLREVAVSSWNQRMDAGESFAQAVADRVRSFPEWKEWIEAWRFEWPTMLKGAKPDVLQVFQQLRKLRQVGRLKGIYALSNWSSETFPIATSRFPFLAEFDGKLISGHEKLVKPQPEFYLRLCDRYALRPEQCLFIDDLSSNIEVARKLGFATHWFRESEGLIRDLNALGLQVSLSSPSFSAR
ncbi:MAG TPA: HAD family phosphatase [Pseudobdellovibrionaceae bacterium]|nr:HAD family phosphatase [Pseudobdellovibrionaceae bacterium]